VHLSIWLGRRELMDLVVSKDLMINRTVHHLNRKLKYIEVFDIKKGKTMVMVVGTMNLPQILFKFKHFWWVDELVSEWGAGGGDTKTG